MMVLDGELLDTYYPGLSSKRKWTGLPRSPVHFMYLRQLLKVSVNRSAISCASSG